MQGAKKDPNASTQDNQDTQAMGRSRGGLSTKIHAAADALGNPTGLVLTPGHASDLDGADILLADIAAIQLAATVIWLN